MKKYLIPLPNKNILKRYKQNIEYRKVSQDSMIVYRGNRYSVLTIFIGSYLGIRIINNQVYIYDNTDLVRCHIIINQLFSKWREVFGNTIIASAIIDRLVHHSIIINIKGKSYRIKDLLQEDFENKRSS